MTDIRIDTTSYRLLPDRSREERKPASVTAIPLQGSAESHTVGRSPPVAGEDQPSLDQLAFPRQQVSPARAAGIYQANIPTEMYTYPYHGVLEGRDAPSDGIENDRKGGHQTVTMVQYEPGSMVDCHV